MLILPEYELIRQIYQGERTVLYRAVHKPCLLYTSPSPRD